jgi:hypothetical protein
MAATALFHEHDNRAGYYREHANRNVYRQDCQEQRRI